MQKSQLVGHLCSFLPNAGWGLMSPVSKAVLMGGIISPLLLTDCRVLGSMILFWCLSLFRPREKVPVRDLFFLFCASQCGVCGNQVLFLTGVSLTSPADASILTTTMPLWVLILSAFFLKQRITGRKLLGLALGMAGALIIIMSGHPNLSSGGSGTVAGDLMVIAAQGSYACYLVFFHRFVARYSIVTIMKWMFLFASLVLLPFSWSGLMEAAWGDLPLVTSLQILYTVVIGTFMCQILIVVSQRHLSPIVTGMYNYVQPLVASIVSIAWGMDHFTWLKAGAVVLICAGVYIVSLAAYKDSPAARTAKKSGA